MSRISSKNGFTLIELAIVIAIIGILAAVAVPRFTDLTTEAHEAVANSLLQSLQSSSAIYVAQQRVPPTVFSDFVTTNGSATGRFTLTLENVQSQLNANAGVATTAMNLTFKSGGTASYYLTGTDVTAAFNF